MTGYLWIGLGSALGGMARHGIASWMALRFPTTIPWGTLIVNVVGSLLIGLILGLPESKFSGPNAAVIRQFLAVGFLGGFTTFSAFSIQTVTLIQNGRMPVALLYILLSVLLCVAAAALGYACGSGSFAKS